MAEERESKSQEMQGKSESKGGGIGLGLGVDITLSVGGLRSVVDELNSVLRSTTETVTGTLGDVFSKIREMGPENIKQWGKEGSEEQQGAYNELVGKLQEAANRGEDEARNLLSEMGESVESAGQGMQETARGEESTSH
jgi:hypothetical protein